MEEQQETNNNNNNNNNSETKTKQKILASNNDFNLDLSLALRPLNNPPLKRKVSTDDEHVSERRRLVKTTSFWLNAENTSSALSDNNYRSNSFAGGNSSDTSSNSSCHRVSSPAANLPTDNPSAKEPVSSQDETRHLNNSNVNAIPQPNQSQCDKKCAALDKEPSPMPRSPSPKEAKVILGKPPKPNRQMSQQSVLLPQMPCVSTTGNGPNGKTISGFLYKYSKTEVSIVCVCHGTSFSPASFIEHAGGVDIEHPLKHIRVVPFALS